MNRENAKHAVELYDAIAKIDRQLDRVYVSHRLEVKAGVWASGATGNYPIELDVPGRSPFAPMMRAAIEGQLLHEREIRAGGLRKIGFEVPEPPSAHSRNSIQTSEGKE